MKVGLTENKDDDSEDTPCDERKLRYYMKGRRLVFSTKKGFQEGGNDEQVKILTRKAVVRQFCQKDGNEAGN